MSRAVVFALFTLAFFSAQFSAAMDPATAQQSTAVEAEAPNEVSEQSTASGAKKGEPREEVPLQQAAEGVDASVVTEKAAPAATQLPFDLKAAADIAIAAFGGEVLKAEQVEDETGIHFHIRVVTEGRVRDVVIDAANGEIIKPIETEVVDALTGPASSDTASAAAEDAQSEPGGSSQIKEGTE